MKKKLIGLLILAGAIAAIHFFRGPPDMSLRDRSLEEMVNLSLKRFHDACERYWNETGPEQNCTKEVFPRVIRGTFDLPGITVAGEGNRRVFHATARHDLLADRFYMIDENGEIKRIPG